MYEGSSIEDPNQNARHCHVQRAQLDQLVIWPMRTWQSQFVTNTSTPNMALPCWLKRHHQWFGVCKHILFLLIVTNWQCVHVHGCRVMAMCACAWVPCLTMPDQAWPHATKHWTNMCTRNMGLDNIICVLTHTCHVFDTPRQHGCVNVRRYHNELGCFHVYC